MKNIICSLALLSLGFVAQGRIYEFQTSSDIEANPDDHLMHIVGKVHDQTGKMYYKAKNSWGTKLGKDGLVYRTVSYLKLKSISVLLHTDGLIKGTKSKLEI